MSELVEQDRNLPPLVEQIEETFIKCPDEEVLMK